MVGWWVYFWIIASALVLLREELRPVLENSLGQGPGPGPKLDNSGKKIFMPCNILHFHIKDSFKNPEIYSSLVISIVCSILLLCFFKLGHKMM